MAKLDLDHTKLPWLVQVDTKDVGVRVTEVVSTDKGL